MQSCCPKIDEICFSLVGKSKASVNQGRKKKDQVLEKKLKKLMKKFLPDNYKQDQFLKMNFMQQYGMSIEEYNREIESLNNSL